MLCQYCAMQAGPVTVPTVLIIPTIPTTPTAPTLSPLNIQIPLPHPSARGMSSSMATPPTPATSLPVERLTQCCATKRQHSTLESGTEDSGAEGMCESTNGGAELETPVELVLQDLMRMHDSFPGPGCIRVEDVKHLLTECDAFTSQLLRVIGMMARQIKELQAGRDTQPISVVRLGPKKIRVERTPLEQKLTNMAKVCTRNYD